MSLPTLTTRPALEPRPTTLLSPTKLSDALGVRITLAAETFQHTGSFKFRAAYRVATSIPNPEVIAVSSGNFGQAIALACQLTGKRCTVVMPNNSASVKIDAVRSYGATTDLIDTTVISREDRVAQLVAQNPDAYVASAYDDEFVIDGNSSLGGELAAVSGGFDAVIAPIGGGGLTSGLIKGLRGAGSAIPVYAAEPAIANDAAQSFRAGHIVKSATEIQTMADGARTRAIGKHNWAILQHGLAGVIEVPEAQIAEALRLLFSLANVKAEPTGSLGIGALLTDPARFANQHVCVVITGGNVDMTRYRDLLGGANTA
jgi:threonine dehydratase